MTPTTSGFSIEATNIWRNHSRPSPEVDTLRTKTFVLKDHVDSHTPAPNSTKRTCANQLNTQRLKISSTMNGIDRKKLLCIGWCKSTSEFSLHRLRRKPVQGCLTLLKTNLRHFLRDLCKIQRIIKFVTISDFFVSIAIFFSHFLAEITRTITFIDHYRLRMRICPMIAIVSAY